jgi:single-strand DNA-binding protein
MSKINLVVLEGNLVRDVELKYTPNGTALCEFTIANSKKWKDGGGEWRERPGFYNCQCWGKRGETINEHFSKGKPIKIQGELVFQQWETKDGQKRNAVKIGVEKFWFVGTKDGAANSGGASNPSFPEGSGAPNEVNEEEIPF